MMRPMINRVAMPIMLMMPLALAACGGEPKQADSAGPASPTADAKPVAFPDVKGDATKGAVVFAQCKSCHSIEPGKTMTGPTMHGVIGRKAASIKGYAYSTGMQKSGLTWDEETLFHYLVSPMKDVPGTKMAFAGIRDAQKRADLIAYLKELK